MLRDFSKEEFDIIIQAGQSNSEGYSAGAVTQPYGINDNILYLNSDFSISIAQERIYDDVILGNFSLSFCTKYVEEGKLQPGRKLLIVRAAIGGSGFLDNRWGLNDDLYIRMMEMITTSLELNPKNKLVAFLWHQGETDSSLGATKEGHTKNLLTLINSVKTTFKSQSLPFVAGDFVQHWKMDNLSICIPVIDAMKDICKSIGNARFVETEELLSNDQSTGNEDPIHFCRESINVLGVKYYKAFCEITDC